MRRWMERTLGLEIRRGPRGSPADALEIRRWRRGPYGHLFGGLALQVLLEHYDFHTVLDVGSGAGDQADAFRRAGRHVTTVDYGRSVYFRDSDQGASFVGDYLEADLPGPYDLVWASHVLEHQPDPQTFLRRLRDDTAEGGLLCVTVPPAKHPLAGGHVTLWNAGLLLYHFVLAGLDCREAAVRSYGYNISVIVRRRLVELPPLHYDRGDLERLAPYLPPGVREGSHGDILSLNWPRARGRGSR